MKTERNTPLLHISQKGSFFSLLVSLLLLLIAYPFLDEGTDVIGLTEIFLFVILLTGVYSVSGNRFLVGISAFLAVVAMSTSVLNIFIVTTHLRVISKIFSGLFFLLFVVIILSHIARAKKVTTDTILGAVCAYLFIGLVWSMVYAIIEVLQPGSFHIAKEVVDTRNEFMYYSFVTMTTLGYGDIVPLTFPARTLSAIEAVTGQLYIAILIAHLVGLRIVHASSEK